MDHVVPLNHDSELDNLVTGRATMIIRGKESYDSFSGMVRKGDILFFLEKGSKGYLCAKGRVSSVFETEKLTVEESFETVIRHQDRLQLPDDQFYTVAGKQFLVILGLEEVESIEPVFFDTSRFTGIDDWISVGSIRESTGISN